MVDDFGYAGKILRVDLSSLSMTYIQTSDYTPRFIGGIGIAAKIYWDEVPPETGAFDSNNELIFMTGPLAGLSGLAGSRWLVCGKSPIASPEHFYYCNLGGIWGAQLKFAGYDGIVIQGKSGSPVYLLLQDGAAELRDASNLWGRNSVETQSLLKDELGSSVSVVTIGPAGENQVSMATVLADSDSSGRGFGAVMGSKKLKAIVVGGRGSRPRVANPEMLRQLVKHIRELRPDGTTHHLKWVYMSMPPENAKKQLCYGCISGCDRMTYEAANGDRGKLFCQPSFFYRPTALGYYGEPNEVPFQAIRLCDKFGIDTRAIDLIIQWLSRCYKAGILTDENTGIPISKLGSIEFMETLVKKISLRDGFGDVLAQGILRAADSVGGKAQDMMTGYVEKAGEIPVYGARLYITNGLFYAIEPSLPIAQAHNISRILIQWRNWLGGLQDAYMSGAVVRAIARRFWGSELAADFSTYGGKALAAKMIQDRGYMIECLVLCERSWPVMDVENSQDHVGDPTLESRIYSAVTGNAMDEKGLNRIGERVFNLKRAILVRDGHRGKEDDQLSEFNYNVPLESDHRNPECLVLGKDGEPVSRKGVVVNRQKFEKMRDEYYQLRGWDIPTGLQTRVKLEELHLEDIAGDLERRGLIM